MNKTRPSTRLNKQTSASSIANAHSSTLPLEPRPRRLDLLERVVPKHKPLKLGIPPLVREPGLPLVGHHDRISVLLFLAVRKMEHMALLRRLQHDPGGSFLPQRLVQGQHCPELTPVLQLPQQPTENRTVFDSHGSALREVRESGMTGVAEEDKLAGWMQPGVHLSRVLEPPLGDLVHHVEQLQQPRVPVLEEVAHVLGVLGRDIDRVREGVGTEEDNVVQPAALEEVADSVGVGAHPQVDCGVFDELDEVVVLAHVAGLDEDAVCEVAGEMRRVGLAHHFLTAARLEPVGADDEVGGDAAAVFQVHAGRVEVDLHDAGVELDVDAQVAGFLHHHSVEVGAVDMPGGEKGGTVRRANRKFRSIVDIPVGSAVDILGQRHQGLFGEGLAVAVSAKYESPGEHGHFVQRFLHAPFNEDPGGIRRDLNPGADLRAGASVRRKGGDLPEGNLLRSMSQPVPG